MVERKFQIFISSTYDDLKSERQGVLKAILDMNHIPSGMEMFPAGNEDQWSLIKRVIDECDYYLVIVGGKYGSLAPDGVGYTEKEYDYAVSQGKHVMGFFHGDQDSLPDGNKETSAPLIEQINAFRSKVQEKMCRPWSNEAELITGVMTSLMNAIRESPAEGWIRARHATSKDTLQLVADLEHEKREMEDRIRNIEAQTSIDTEKIASGDDIFNLRVKMEGLRSNRTGIHASHGFIGIPMTWDEIFAFIGTVLINSRNHAQISQFIKSHLKDACLENCNFDIRRIQEVHHADVETILLQFCALGLLDSRADGQCAWWLITQPGKRHLMQIRAIKNQGEIEQ